MDDPASSEATAFAEGVIALSYVFGRRGAELGALMSPTAALAPTTMQFVEQLSQPQRKKRAYALALRLARVVRALRERRLRL